MGEEFIISGTRSMSAGGATEEILPTQNEAYGAIKVNWGYDNQPSGKTDVSFTQEFDGGYHRVKWSEELGNAGATIAFAVYSDPRMPGTR
jgi:hypothetical protein